MASSQQSISKPTSSYWLWLGDNRERITKMVGGKGSDVAKKGGELWKALTASAKQPYEKQAQEKKAAYEKFITTEEGQKALKEKKDAKADDKAEKSAKAEAKAQEIAKKEEMRNDRACKAALKAVEKDDALKKPQSAYWLWLADNREKVSSSIGSQKGSLVAKKAGEMWKALTDSQRLPYEKKAKEQKETYDKFIASDEGQKALQTFKDAKQEAKDQFKPKEEPVVEAADGDKKRKADSENTADAEVGAKKARGRPAKAKAAVLGA
jgi:upstream-binding transcription factor